MLRALLTKRNTLILLAAGLVAITAVMSGNILSWSTKDLDNSVIEFPTSRAHYNNFDELAQRADLIVLAQSLNNFNEQEHHVEYADADKKLIKEIYTLSDVKIKKIIKNTGPDQFTVGQTIKFIEPASVINGQVVVLEGYSPIKKNSSYVLFLKKNMFGNYSILNMNGGKYNLDNTDSKDSGNGEEAQEKQKFKKVLLNRFEKQLNS